MNSDFINKQEEVESPLKCGLCHEAIPRGTCDDLHSHGCIRVFIYMSRESVKGLHIKNDMVFPLIQRLSIVEGDKSNASLLVQTTDSGSATETLDEQLAKFSISNGNTEIENKEQVHMHDVQPVQGDMKSRDRERKETGN